MKKIISIFLLLNLFFLYQKNFSQVLYKENVLIYKNHGIILNFLYAQYYEKTDSFKIKIDRNLNLNSENIWQILKVANLNSTEAIRYGDQIKLSQKINDETYFLNPKSSKTEIKKRERGQTTSNTTISSYLDVKIKKQSELTSEQIQSFGIYKILNPLNPESTDYINNSNPVILEIINNEENKSYLTSAGIFSSTSNLWFITPMREL